MKKLCCFLIACVLMVQLPLAALATDAPAPDPEVDALELVTPEEDTPAEPDAEAPAEEAEPPAAEETEAPLPEPEAGLAGDEPTDEPEAAPAASNTHATAYTATVNTFTPEYSFADANEVHWFKFTLPSDGVYSFTFRNMDTTKAQAWGWDVDLYYATENGYNTTAIDTYAFSNKTPEFSSAIDPKNIPNIGLPKGDYYIRVMPDGKYGLNINYKFQVGFEARTD